MSTASGYGKGAVHILSRGLDWANDTIQCGLFTSSYVPDVDNDEFLSAITGNEVSDVTYARQGLTSLSVSYSADQNGALCLSNQVVFSNLHATFRYVVFWKYTGSDATSTLLFYIDYEGDQFANYVTWTVALPSNGYMMIQV